MRRDLPIFTCALVLLGCGFVEEGLSPDLLADGGARDAAAGVRSDAPGGAAGGAGGTGGAPGGAGGTGGIAGLLPPPPSPGQIECGGARCSAETSQCCATTTGGTCTASGGGCGTNAVRRCDGPEDCRSGEICCAREVSTGLYRSQCARSDSCQGGLAMCHGQADCPGLKCCPVMVAPSNVLWFCRAGC